MNDKSIKKWMGYVLRNKKRLSLLLDNFRPEDLENGLLVLPEALINEQLAPDILGAASPWVTGYQVSFSNNMIFLDANINAKQAGPARAMMMLSVDEFTFRPDAHRLRFQYREDVRSLGNPAQAVMLNLFLSNSGLLSKLISMNSAALPGVTADGRTLSVDLDRLTPQLASGPLQRLTLRYAAAGDGVLKLQFEFA